MAKPTDPYLNSVNPFLETKVPPDVPGRMIDVTIRRVTNIDQPLEVFQKNISEWFEYMGELERVSGHDCDGSTRIVDITEVDTSSFPEGDPAAWASATIPK